MTGNTAKSPQQLTLLPENPTSNSGDGVVLDEVGELAYEQGEATIAMLTIPVFPRREEVVAQPDSQARVPNFATEILAEQIRPKVPQGGPQRRRVGPDDNNTGHRGPVAWGER